MGLFYKIYRDRSGDSLVASVYEALVSRGSVEDFFPRYFDYETRNGTIRKPLFGDLPRALMARIVKRQGSVSVDAAYRAMPTHHTPTEFDAKGSSGQSAWAGMMPDAAAAPPTPVNRASKWPGWKK
jgi:hypothetical protein